MPMVPSRMRVESDLPGHAMRMNPVKRRTFSDPLSNARSAADQRVGLDGFVSFGDVVAIRNSNLPRLAQIGATGGFMGHVMLITGSPMPVHAHTVEAEHLRPIWPQGRGIDCLWKVPSLESTRGANGYHETELVMAIEPKDGRLLLLGEFRIRDGVIELTEFDNGTGVVEECELWRCPSELRFQAFGALLEQALIELKSEEANWSWSTAVRAFMFAGELGPGEYFDLSELKRCWHAQPICTSIVVSFWQRVLCKMAERKGVHGGDAINLIRKWMPLKADRVMPGELVSTLRSHGWQHWVTIPRALSGNMTARSESH